MIVKQNVKEFEKLGFGLFVHFGLYSVIGKGEWAQENLNIPADEYVKSFDTFAPDKDWAINLAKAAAQSGCKYINLTTCHHDGFALYDTCGLNDFDAPHACGRDLVKEFTDACREVGIKPFFYHTLFDWHTDLFDRDFKEYLKQLRNRIELLCTNYGEVGGFWFDGSWRRPGADWEEDALYSVIRKYQQNAVIVNNTGMVARGQTGHIEIDSVTFERGKPIELNFEGAPKYLASEMCQTMNDHWGYAANDINYKSPGQLIMDFAQCRRYRSNFLLNVGPLADGSIHPIEKEVLKLLGRWANVNSAALYETAPAGIEADVSDAFILFAGDDYYLFADNIPMTANQDVALYGNYHEKISFSFDKKVKSACWLDDGSNAEFIQENGKVTITIKPFEYGRSFCVRVCHFSI